MHNKLPLFLATMLNDISRLYFSKIYPLTTRSWSAIIYMLQQCGCSLVVELQPSKLIVWVRFPSSAPKSKAPNGCLIFLVKRIGNRRRALRKQSGGLFLARAQMTLCRCSRPGKRRRWGPLKLTHIIRSKKTRRPTGAFSFWSSGLGIEGER